MEIPETRYAKTAEGVHIGYQVVGQGRRCRAPAGPGQGPAARGEPGDAVAGSRERDTDVRHVLPSIQIPTLALHRTADRVEPVEQGRCIAEHVPGARLLELDGDDHIWPMDDLVPNIAGFLDSIRAEDAEFDRVLRWHLYRVVK